MKKSLQRNIPLYLAGEFFGELLFIIPIFVAYERQFLTFSQMSFLAAARFAFTLLLELPTGAFADLVGRKFSTASGFIINTCGILVIAFAGGAQALIVGTIIRSIGDSFISGSTTALVYDSLKEMGREKQFGRVRANGVLAVQFAIIISSIFGGYLFGIWKGLPYLAYALSTTIAAGLYLFAVEPSIDSTKFTLHIYIRQNIMGFKELFKTSFARHLSAYYALVGGLTLAWQIHFNQIFATSIGYSEVEKGWLFAIIRFINVIVIIRLLHLDRFITKSRVALFFPALILIGTIPSILNIKFIDTGLLFIMTLASTLRFILLDQYVNELFDSRLRATAISSLNLLVGIVYICIVSLIGPIMDHFPSYMVMLLGATITIIFILPQGIALSKKSISVH